MVMVMTMMTTVFLIPCAAMGIRPEKGAVTGLAPWLNNGPCASGMKVLGKPERAFLI